MKKYKIGIEEVYDLFAVRFVLKCAREDEKRLCWQTYSIVTDYNTPNPDRLRDWISIPKSNGYESLHTTVITPQGRWVEVQIRSERMDDVAEHGVAAHWRYKGVSGNGIGSEEWLAKVRQMIENGVKELTSDDTPDIKLTSKEIFVFTPNGDLRKLNDGATILDFAYNIHSELGNTCIGAKVNHKSVSIKHKLRNGDIVEILTLKKQRPKSDWLNIVTSSKAKSRIKAFLKEEQSKRAYIGREEIERKIKNWKLDISFDEAVAILLRHFKIKNALDLYTKISEEEIETSTIKEILTDFLSPTTEREEQPVEIEENFTYESSSDDDCLMIDKNLSGIEYKFGRCCNPILGDPIFGFVTIATGITIHRTDCPNANRLRNQYPYRVIEAKWKSSADTGRFRATLKIQARNTFGLVNKITEILNKDLKINIGAINFTEKDSMTIEGSVTIEVANIGILDAAIYKLLKIKDIERVTRLK
jgi:GTP pyrophosphokinase